MLSLSLEAQVSFTAKSDAAKVLSNGYFTVSFTLSNGDGKNFIPPSFNDFQVLSGPNQSSQTTIVNNARSQSVTISYQLQPNQLGKLTVGAAKITANGRQLSTTPISIESIRGQTSRNDGSEKIFLEARINQESAYLGQQLTLDYVFYYSVDIQSLNPLKEASYEGFHTREVHDFNKQSVTETINGKKFFSQIIKRVVLYPQQTGKVIIDPFSIMVGIQKPGQTQSRFRRPDLQKTPVMSNELSINISSLPNPQPDNFSEITGNYQMQIRINKREITTDDALSVIIHLSGEGDLKRVQAPDLSFPDGFDIYDPSVLKEEYIDKPNSIQGIKTFEYLLVPNNVGRFTFQPELIIFNPDSNRYQTLQSKPIEIDVSQGSGDKKSGLVAEANTASALFPAKKDILLYSKSSLFIGTPLFWLLFLAPLLSAAGLWYYKYAQSKQPDIDPVLLKQQQARQEAIKRLDAAHSFMGNNNSKAFFNEVEDALLGYVTDKLQIPRADLTKVNVEAKLSLLGANETQRSKFNKLIQNCEMALYAGVNNEHAMAETYEQSLALLAEMEEVLS